MKTPSPRLAAITALLCLAQPGYSYIRLLFSYTDGTSAYMTRNDSTNIQFYVNDQITPSLRSDVSGSEVTVISPGSNPVAAIRAAMASWNALSGSGARFLPLRSAADRNDPSDNRMTVSVGDSAGDLSTLGTAIAVTVLAGESTPEGARATGDISDSDIVLNPGIAFSTDGSTGFDLQAVMTHEFGHALGLNHTGLFGAVMFQYVQIGQRYLSTDETSFANALYPSGGRFLGIVNGRVIAADGSAVQAALVTMLDASGGNMLCALTGPDGTYSLQVPAGSYLVYVEPMTTGSIVQPGNLYLSSSTLVTSNFRLSVLGGIDSPSLVSAGSGGTITAPDLVVTAGNSTLTPPYIGLGSAGSAGDIQTLARGTSFAIPSGQSVDIGLATGGIDGTVSIQVYGQGITVRPGSVRVDPLVTIGGQPLVRATLDVAARKSSSLASLKITKGSDAFAISGVLAIQPPTPTFPSNALLSAASYLGAGGRSAVSPGGIYSIYDTLKGSLGPDSPAVAGSYDVYGNLATTLGGVTVTFDGVPSPLYFTSAGQINFQVPFETAGKISSTMVVNFAGSGSVPLAVPVVSSQPAFFTVTPLGLDALVQNYPDYSLNGAGNPSPRGGVVLIYGTGIGKLPYSLATGQPGVVPPGTYTSNYTCSFGGQSAAAYAYWNFGYVGEALWAVTLPSGAPTGAVSMVCKDLASGASTQLATVYIR